MKKGRRKGNRLKKITALMLVLVLCIPNLINTSAILASSDAFSDGSGSFDDGDSTIGSMADVTTSETDAVTPSEPEATEDDDNIIMADFVIEGLPASIPMEAASEANMETEFAGDISSEESAEVIEGSAELTETDTEEISADVISEDTENESDGTETTDADEQQAETTTEEETAEEEEEISDEDDLVEFESGESSEAEVIESDEPVIRIYSDEEVEITATAEPGAVPEDVQLRVIPIKEEDLDTEVQYMEVSEKLEADAAEKEEELLGFLAYDIAFVRDVDGVLTEVEPTGEVSVNINYLSATTPVTEETVNTVAENAGVDAAEVQPEVAVVHFEETAEQDINLVDMTENSTATVETTEANKVSTIDLTTDSFSVFTVKWTWKSGDRNRERSISVKVGQEKDSIFSELNTKLKDITFNSSSKAFDFSKISSNNDDYKEYYSFIENGVEYTFVKAVLRSDWNNRNNDSYKLSKLAIKDNKVRAYRNKGNVDLTDNNGNAKDDEVYMIYRPNITYTLGNVKLTNEKGTSIGEDITLTLSGDSEFVFAEQATELGQIQPEINSDGHFYTYDKAIVINSVSAATETKAVGTEKVASALKYDSSSNSVMWKNASSGEYASLEEDESIAIVYAAGELTTVNTVDSTSLGVTMVMKNYDTSGGGLSIDGSYGDGTIKKGLLNPTLDNKGYPVTTGGVSLKSLFDGGTQVNHLFLQDTYNSTGYLEYSAFENYAYLGNNTDFTVYNQIGTPSNEDRYFYKRGNFMPYNNISADKYSTNKNLYDENGKALPESDPRYNEKLYKTQGNNDFYFGMYINADFFQTAGGQVTNNGVTTNMRYEFNGDDDLWIYIDDVLVLDIGGIHDAHSGYIDFATGEVGWYDCETGKTPNLSKTTIKAMFEAAGAVDNIDWNGNTFADYTVHNFKMFYMERGAGASNLHMKLNLPTIPEGSVEVKKELTNTDKEKYANVEFKFQVYAQEILSTDNKGQETYSDSNYVLLDSNAVYKGTTTPVTFETYTDDNENTYEKVFTLKPGQSAVFTGLQENRKYYVKEVGVKSSEYDKVIINGQEFVDGSGIAQGVVQTSDASVVSRPVVICQNNCSAANSKELRITKQISDGITTEDTFSFKVYLENKDGILVPYSGNYYLTPERAESPNPLTTSDGVISGIKAGDTVSITQILSGTDFLVEEINLDGTKYQPYQISLTEGTYETVNPDTCAKTQDGSKSAQGSILLGQDAYVTVTNNPYRNITVTKVWENGNAPEGTVIYAGLYKDDAATDKYVTLSGDNRWSATFSQLTEGTYTVKELEETDATGEFTIDGKSYIGTDGFIVIGDNEYSVSPVSEEIKLDSISSEVTLTNTKLESVTVTKKWMSGGQDVTGDHVSDTITVGLFQKDSSDVLTIKKVVTLNSDKNGTWTYTFNRLLPLEDGNSYVVRELKQAGESDTDKYTDPDDSTKQYVAVPANDIIKLTDASSGEDDSWQVSYDDTKAEITNTKLAKIRVTKSWSIPENGFTVPDSTEVIVGLYKVENNTETLVDAITSDQKAVVTLNKENSWTAFFDVAVPEGDLSAYVVREVIQNTDGTYSPVAEDGYILIGGDVYQVDYSAASVTGDIHSYGVTNTLVLGQLTINKTDTGKKALAGAQFELVKKDDTTIKYSGTTNDDGQLIITDIIPGEYTLTETKSPAGYSLLANSVDVTIPVTDGDTDKYIGNVAGADEGAKYYFELTLEIINNELFDMPQGGGSGTKTMTFAGIFFIIAAAGITLFFRRRRIY